jgi:PTH1 family peptidyl-tRNA hydrolase
VIIVGLGNPGQRYESTRHNVGFRAIDLIAERWGRPAFVEKYSGKIARVQAGAGGSAEPIYLLKPMTFMNASGDSVQPAAAYFKHSPEQVLVIHDELDLPLGRIQFKRGGGAGGHNGLKSVSGRLGNEGYLRLRLGIGRPPGDFRGDVADFVLQAVAPAEQSVYRQMLEEAADAVELLLSEGASAAMNQTNRRPKSGT